MGEYKFKEKIPMRRVEYVIDKEDGEGQGQLVFRLQFNLHNSVVSKTLIIMIILEKIDQGLTYRIVQQDNGQHPNIKLDMVTAWANKTATWTCE